MNANGAETKIQESKSCIAILNELYVRITLLLGRTTYMIEAPAPPEEEEEVVKRRTEIIREGPASEVPRSVREWDMMSNNLKSERSPSPGAKSAKSHKTSKTSKTHKTSKSRNVSPSAKSSKSRHRSVSEASTRREIFVPVEDHDESATIHGFAGALQVHESRSSNRRDTQSIKAEIKALEAEKKALKYEREMERERQKADRYRDSEVEIVRERDVVKIEKDRKGRLSLVR